MVVEEFADRNSLAEMLAGKIHATLAQHIETHGKAFLVVSGGSSPLKCLQALSELSLDWSRVMVTLSDERCVPVSHEASNERMVRENLLINHAAEARFVPLDTSSLLAAGLPPTVSLVGMGEDGHFASIFPDNPDLANLLDLKSDEITATIKTAASEYERVTMTLSYLCRSTELYLLVFGDTKRKIYRSPAGYPVAGLLNQTRVPVEVYWAP